jgi:hypothetical protein
MITVDEIRQRVGGAGLISYCGLSHPPTLRTSRRALCPTTSTDYINGTSKLACCASFEGYACRSHCARGGSTSLDFTIRLVPRAHSGSRGAMCVSFISCSGVGVGRARETNNRHSVCAYGEHKRPTGQILIPSASTRIDQADPPSLLFILSGFA